MQLPPVTVMPPLPLSWTEVRHWDLMHMADRMINHHYPAPSIPHFVFSEGIDVLQRSVTRGSGLAMTVTGSVACPVTYGLGCVVAAKGLDNRQADVRGVDTYTQQGIEWGFYRMTGDQALSGMAGVIGNGVLDIGFSGWGMTRLVPGNNPFGGMYNSRWYSNERHGDSPHWQRGYQDMSRMMFRFEIISNIKTGVDTYRGVSDVSR